MALPNLTLDTTIFLVVPLTGGDTLVEFRGLLGKFAVLCDRTHMPIREVAAREVAGLVLASYPTTARPGCCPLRATASGEINGR